jgi:two-component system sensor histidine kinase ChvG
VAKLIGDICALYEASRREGDPAVRFATPPSEAAPFLIVGREGPIGQVLRNLIDNARSFSPRGGTVTVSISRGQLSRSVVIQVEDEGPGVPPDNLESIFERFYTERPPGGDGRRPAFGGHSGLGLSIARQIVEVHGGAIHAENRRDAAAPTPAGARFVISFPAAG